MRVKESLGIVGLLFLSMVTSCIVIADDPYLMVDDFNREELGTQWIIRAGDGVRLVQDGPDNYVLKMGGPGLGSYPRSVYAGDTSWTDYEVEVDFRFDSSIDPNNATILVRATDVGEYSVGLLYGTRFRITKRVIAGDKYHNLAIVEMDSFLDGQFHRLRVVCRGPSIEAYIDDVFVASAVDTGALDVEPFLTGRVGLRAHGSDVSFDNFVVSQID